VPGIPALARCERRWLPKDVLAGVSIAGDRPAGRPRLVFTLMTGVLYLIAGAAARARVTSSCRSCTSWWRSWA
jgi:hypothetical protein